MNILYEGMARELGAVINDDPGRDPEAAHQSFQELDCLLSTQLSHGLYFRPLCKLVDCNEQEFKAPGSSGERAEDIEAPDRKRP